MASLNFEKPIVELEEKIQELKDFQARQGDGKHGVNLGSEIKKLEEKLSRLRQDVYAHLTPWQRVQLARHPHRPYTLDYVAMLCEKFSELHGDRCFGDDKAMIAGLATIEKRKCMIIGQQKGRDTQDNIYRNFGCAHPEGYRKALRMMQLAEKFKLPVVVFIDTPGAYPGVGAEERGQAQAIAWNLREMVHLRTPVIIYVIGEGGSGGALGIGIGDRICVLENAYYSVISPEGCAAILWKNSAKANEAATALRLTADDLLSFGIIDEVVSEPLGGAHRDPERTAQYIQTSLVKHLGTLTKMPLDTLLSERYERFRRIGVFTESS